MHCLRTRGLKACIEKQVFLHLLNLRKQKWGPWQAAAWWGPPRPGCSVECRAVALPVSSRRWVRVLGLPWAAECWDHWLDGAATRCASERDMGRYTTLIHCIGVSGSSVFFSSWSILGCRRMIPQRLCKADLLGAPNMPGDELGMGSIPTWL